MKSSRSANLATALVSMAGKFSELFFNIKSGYTSSSSSKQHSIFHAEIIDPGASNHMCHDKTIFKTIQSLPEPY